MNYISIIKTNKWIRDYNLFVLILQERIGLELSNYRPVPRIGFTTIYRKTN